MNRFEFYVNATGITTAHQKQNLLLHTAGPDVQDIIMNEVGMNQTGNTLDSLIQAITNHFAGQTNITLSGTNSGISFKSLVKQSTSGMEC